MQTNYPIILVQIIFVLFNFFEFNFQIKSIEFKSLAYVYHLNLMSWTIHNYFLIESFVISIFYNLNHSILFGWLQFNTMNCLFHVSRDLKKRVENNFTWWSPGNRDVI